MNLSPKIRLAISMETARSFNKCRVGFWGRVDPFSIHWRGEINSSVIVGAAFGVALAWLFSLPSYFFVMGTRDTNAGGRRMGSFFIACLRWKTGKKEGKAGD